jgi:MHS family proline/betaine transporter-like MFS transporter
LQITTKDITTSDIDIMNSRTKIEKDPMESPDSEPEVNEEKLATEFQAHHKRLIIAGTVGNVLEWYDFAVYGFFAHEIGRAFFPSTDPVTSLIAAFGAFAAGFLMRPFGAVVFGHIADSKGRRAAMTLSVLCMAFPTFCIGILPGYETLGPAAAVILVLMRMLQGMSVGGEFATSLLYLVEHAPSGRKAFAGSWGAAGATGGTLAGSAVGFIINRLLSPEQVALWGWRVPMLLGLAVGLAGLFIRKHLPEETHKPDPAQAPPIVTAFREHWRDMFRVAGVMLMGSVGFYLIFVFLTTYLSQTVKVPIAQALEINTFSMIVLMLLIPFYGHLADKIGPARIVVTSAFACLILAWPLFWLLHHQNPWIDLIGQLGFVMVIAPYQGAYPALVVQMLPKNARCTVLSVGFNLCVGLIGGTTPMVASYLIKKTHDDLAPAWFLMIASFITWITVYMWQLKLKKERISTMKTSS